MTVETDPDDGTVYEEFPIVEYPFQRKVQLARVLKDPDEFFTGVTMELTYVQEPFKMDESQSYLYFREKEDLRKLIVQLVESLVAWESE